MVQGYTSAACRRAESSGFDASARGTYSQYLIRLNGAKPLSGCRGDPPLGWPRYVRPVCPPLKMCSKAEGPDSKESGPSALIRMEPSGLGEFVLLLPHQGKPVADVPHAADQVLMVGT